MLEIRCHDLKEVRGHNLLEDELAVGEADNVVEDMRDFLADVKGSFIVQQVYQLFCDDLLAKDDGCCALIGAEVRQDPARILAEDRVRAHHKLEDAIQEVALEQGVGIVLHFLAKNIAKDTQC